MSVLKIFRQNQPVLNVPVGTDPTPFLQALNPVTCPYLIVQNSFGDYLQAAGAKGRMIVEGRFGGDGGFRHGVFGKSQPDFEKVYQTINGLSLAAFKHEFWGATSALPIFSAFFRESVFPVEVSFREIGEIGCPFDRIDLDLMHRRSNALSFPDSQPLRFKVLTRLVKNQMESPAPIHVSHWIYVNEDSVFELQNPILPERHSASPVVPAQGKFASFLVVNQQSTEIGLFEAVALLDSTTSFSLSLSQEQAALVRMARESDFDLRRWKRIVEIKSDLFWTVTYHPNPK